MRAACESLAFVVPVPFVQEPVLVKWRRSHLLSPAQSQQHILPFITKVAKLTNKYDHVES